MEQSDTSLLYVFDRDFESLRSVRVAGVDEAGRGPLAGPVVAGAVILDLQNPILGINDSKKLSEKKREDLYTKITQNAVCWAVGSASPQEIDKLNILRASLLAMQRALDGLSLPWTCVLVDGNMKIPTLLHSQQETVVKGDGLSASIAAASIIAKVTRDRIMTDYSDIYPEYEFSRHKGYPTELHRGKVIQYGMSSIHRRSVCESLISQTSMRFD